MKGKCYNHESPTRVLIFRGHFSDSGHPSHNCIIGANPDRESLHWLISPPPEEFLRGQANVIGDLTLG
jgi:hypothetical protein